MPDPEVRGLNTYSDAEIMAGYVTWLQEGNQAGEDRRRRLPDPEVQVEIKPVYGPKTAPASQKIPIGHLLYRFLDPQNRGLEVHTKDALEKMQVPVEYVEEMGENVEGLRFGAWYIHPSVLTNAQREKWGDPDSLERARNVVRLYTERGVEEGTVPSGYCPPSEDEWSKTTRRFLYRASAGLAEALSPPVAWALIDKRIRLERGEVGGLYIHPDYQRGRENAVVEIRDKNAIILDFLFRRGIVRPGYRPSDYIRGQDVPASLKHGVNRLCGLSGTSRTGALSASEYTVVTGVGNLETEEIRRKNGEVVHRISMNNPPDPVREIVRRARELAPGDGPFPDLSAQQQNSLMGAASATVPSFTNDGQPYQAPAGQWAAAARQFTPSTSGYGQQQSATSPQGSGVTYGAPTQRSMGRGK
ncbi:hypothetical protein [Streptomyces sp. NPDC059850]|uniref:hypothetical protein n=1 Tax=Streptomyces sp. NPDC059850 TaxID=3346970 RepID=UPI003669E1BE